MHQLQIQQCCTSCSFLPLRPATPQMAQPRVQITEFNRTGVRTQAWTQVLDQASGKPYYWNTATNETAWEIPSAAAATPSPASAAPQQDHQQQPQEQQQQADASMSNDALFDVLAAAYAADGSGMQFWEVARAHRIYGVFEPPFFDYLDQRQKAAGAEGDAEQKELAFKMMCRLANPLLRQPAPFE